VRREERMKEKKWKGKEERAGHLMAGVESKEEPGPSRREDMEETSS
jgi:hypothetical protein